METDNMGARLSEAREVGLRWPPRDTQQSAAYTDIKKGIYSMALLAQFSAPGVQNHRN